MPTRYTSDIYNGKELTGKEFIMKCARAFGALVEMRDDSLDAPIPEEFKPSDYHLKSLEESKSQLAKIQNIDMEEIQSLIDKEYEEKIKYYENTLLENKKMKSRYLNTLSQVLEWQPPTPDHRSLKEFAVEQLKSSINFDCEGFGRSSLQIEKPTVQQYIQSKIDSCKRNINYHFEEYQKEVDRVSQRNKWIKELRESFE